jgi:hypothetical protein
VRGASCVEPLRTAGDDRLVRIAAGRLFALFSFDLGFEIDLGRAREALPEGVRAGMGGGGKIAPAHVQYASPPLVQSLGVRRLLVIERAVDADVALRLHEFGAASIIFSMPFDDVDGASLPALTAALTTRSALEVEARAILAEVLPRVAAAIVRPNLDGADLVEDYYVIQVSRFEPALDADALVGAHRDLLARVLHCETARLSPTETDEVLRTAVTYTPDDLVVTDWNVALVYDREYQDVLNVLELLNVQLLELRHLDRTLDTRIARLYEHVARRRGLWSLGPTALRVRELSELRLDTATLRERMINALKLVGDLYLTKIYTRTADRLHLAEWQRSIDGKLEVIQNVANVFASRAATARAELLELTIILLIVLEIVLVFVGR